MYLHIHFHVRAHTYIVGCRGVVQLGGLVLGCPQGLWIDRLDIPPNLPDLVDPARLLSVRQL